MADLVFSDIAAIGPAATRPNRRTYNGLERPGPPGGTLRPTLADKGGSRGVHIKRRRNKSAEKVL
jgi:hypothetical protein